MKNIHEKAEVLIEALPYIQKFKGKTFVIKYGGNVMTDMGTKKSIIADIALLKHVGINAVIVHGGGPKISKEMQKEHIIPQFVNGLRYTDKKTMEIVNKVSKELNDEICLMLGNEHCKAENITKKLIKSKVKNPDLGLVGEISSIDKEKLMKKIKSGIIPVISPIGGDKDNLHNINADTVATKIAEIVKAEKLTILTNVDGVYEEGELIPHLSIKDAKEGIKKGIISRGMIPKVMACVHAVQSGVGKAHLIDGTLSNSLLLEIFTDKGIGTEIVKNGNE
jgi:acetylglutamate kinase